MNLAAGLFLFGAVAAFMIECIVKLSMDFVRFVRGEY